MKKGARVGERDEESGMGEQDVELESPDDRSGSVRNESLDIPRLTTGRTSAVQSCYKSIEPKKTPY